MLQIQAYKDDGTKITSGLVVMYRTRANGRWLPWVSNAASAWMHSVQRKYDLDGSLDTRSYYAGIPGVNIEGVEIRVFEETEVYTSDGPKTPTGDYKIINALLYLPVPRLADRVRERQRGDSVELYRQ